MTDDMKFHAQNTKFSKREKSQANTRSGIINGKEVIDCNESVMCKPVIKEDFLNSLHLTQTFRSICNSKHNDQIKFSEIIFENLVQI